MKKYVVALTPAERAELEALTRKGACKARKLKRALVLLAADEGHPDAVIAERVRVHEVTVERIRRRCVEEGLAAALAERPRPGQARKLAGRQEAYLLALACTEPPAGRALGMLVPSLDYYWPHVARGAEEAARELDLRVVLRGSSYETVNDKPQLARLLDQQGVDALVVAPRMDAPTAQATIEWLAGIGIPVVLLERTATAGPHHAVLESVVTDHALGALHERSDQSVVCRAQCPPHPRRMSAGVERHDVRHARSRGSVHRDGGDERVIPLDVHDVGDYKVGGEWRVLEEGMVMTVEPGIYVSPHNAKVARKWRGIGIRIEDDVAVTRGGNEVLTSDVVKAVRDIENLMAESRAA